MSDTEAFTRRTLHSVLGVALAATTALGCSRPSGESGRVYDAFWQWVATSMPSDEAAVEKTVAIKSINLTGTTADVTFDVRIKPRSGTTDAGETSTSIAAFEKDTAGSWHFVERRREGTKPPLRLHRVFVAVEHRRSEDGTYACPVCGGPLRQADPKHPRRWRCDSERENDHVFEETR